MYDVRYAKKEDLPLIVDFLHNYWKPNHALVVSEKLMDFQHLNPITGGYNFIIAQNINSKSIDAIKGFIPTYQYDVNLEENGDVWAAIWKVRKDIQTDETKNLAVYLWEKYFELPKMMSFASIGLSKDAINIHKATRAFVSILNHYYILNDSYEKYNIAEIKESNKIPNRVYSEKVLIKEIILSDIANEDIKKGDYRPKKSLEYLKNRYQNHPIYNYKFLGVFVKEELFSIWVVRIVKVNKSKAIRIIDMYGEKSEKLPYLYENIQTLLNEFNAEYIDCLNHGFNEGVFYAMGFLKVDSFSDKVIIPDYFEPFEQRNNSLYFTYKLKNKNDKYVVFKGDADQDRPNIIKQ